MAFENINDQALQPLQHIHVPALGGLDSISPKTQAQPGTLYRCKNFEVDLESGYKFTDGIALYTNRGFTLPTKFLSSSVDAGSSTASLTDFIVGGIYEVATTEGTLLGEIRYLGTTNESGTDFFHYEVVKSDSPDLRSNLDPETTGSVDVFIGATGSSNSLRLDTLPSANIAASLYLSRYKAIASQLSTGISGPPGQGSITGLFFFQDKLYAARTNVGGTGSVLYRSPDLSKITAEPVWEAVDMGHEVEFKSGQEEPLTFYDKEFIGQSDVPSPTKDLLPRAGSISTAPGTSSSPLLNKWSNLSNVATKSGGDDTFAIARQNINNDNGTVGDWEVTDYMLLTDFDIASIPKTAQVTGIEVTVRHGYGITFPETGTTPEGRVNSIKLLGVGDSDDKLQATPQTLDNTSDMEFFTTTFGGSADTWNATGLSNDNVLSKQFGVQLQLATRILNAASASNGTGTVGVAWVTVKLTFSNRTEKVFFWDGMSDVAEGDVVNISLTESSFATGNAKGWLSLYNVNNPASVVSDLEIRSASGGLGSVLATTAAAMEANELPTSTEMDDNNSKMVTKVTNFFLDPDKVAVYGATGAGPAFQYNGTHFWFIHTPVPEGKDKPRYVAKHQNHLALSFDSGAILVSRVGDPNTFSGLLGASSHEFDGKEITGLLNLSGNALGVFTNNTVEALLGTSLNNFTTQTLAGSGALHYTVHDVGQPVFTDMRGVSNLQAAQTYGDFNLGRVSQLISKDIQRRIQLKEDIISIDSEVNFALPVKNKNQYRIFYNNGKINTMTLFDAGDIVPMFTEQEYKVDRSDDPGNMHYIAAGMQQKAVGGGEPQEGLKLYTVSSDALELVDEIRVPNVADAYNQSISDTEFSPDDTLVATANSSFDGDQISLFRRSGDTLTWLDGGTSDGNGGAILSWNAAGDRIILATDDSPTGPIKLYSIANDTLTRVATSEIVFSTNHQGIHADFLSDGDVIIQTRLTGTEELHLIGTSGDSFTVKDSLTLSTTANSVKAHPTNDLAVVSIGSDVIVYDLSGDTISVLDTFANSNGQYATWSADGNTVYTDAEILSFDGATLTKVDDLPAPIASDPGASTLSTTLDNMDVNFPTPTHIVTATNDDTITLTNIENTPTVVDTITIAGDPFFPVLAFSGPVSPTDPDFKKIKSFATDVTSKGLERIAISNSIGEIFLVDQGNPGIAYKEYLPFAYELTMNPFFANAPFINIKYNEVMIHVKTAGRENISTLSGVNFLLPDDGMAVEDSISIGEDTTLLDLDLIPSRVSTHLPNVTDGFSLSLKGTTEGYPAPIVQALTYKITGLSDANRSPKTY